MTHLTQRLCSQRCVIYDACAIQSLGQREQNSGRKNKAKELDGNKANLYHTHCNSW